MTEFIPRGWVFPRDLARVLKTTRCHAVCEISRDFPNYCMFKTMKMRHGWETSDIHEIHCKEDPINVFQDMKLHGLVPNS